MPITTSVDIQMNSVNINVKDLEDLTTLNNQYTLTANALLNSVNNETAVIIDLLDGPGSASEGASANVVTDADIDGTNYCQGSQGNVKNIVEVTNPAGTVNEYITTFFYQNATYPYVMTSYNKIPYAPA